MKQPPKYMQLYRLLQAQIRDGSYPYGSKLPSKRVLAEQQNVSIMTVTHTYELLTEEGYIYPRERSGYLCIYKPDDRFYTPAQTDIRPRPIERPGGDFPFSAFAKCMRRTLADYADSLFVRCEGSGCAELKQAICRYLSRSRGMQVSPEQIVIGAGAEYLYGLLIQLLGRERVYAIEQPSYEKIESVYRANGVSYRLLPLGNDGIRSEALRETDASVLHITPYRSFPSGVTASASKKQEYLRWAATGDRFLIEDDFESEFSLTARYAGHLFASDRSRENVLYVNTFSKTLSPAIRMAYMLLPPSLAPRYEQILGFYSCTVPTFEQYAVARFIESGEFERHINRVRRAMRK